MESAAMLHSLEMLQPGDNVYLPNGCCVVTDVFFVSSGDVRFADLPSEEHTILLTCDTTAFSDGDYAGRMVVLAERTHV
jgi:sortase (surface protein transpeptidase)